MPREGGLGRKDAEGDLDEVGVVGVVGVVAGEHESALGAGVAGLEVAERAGERAGEAGGRAAIAEDPTETRVPKMTTSSARSASSTDAVKLMGKEASHASAVVGAGTVEESAAATTETRRA